MKFEEAITALKKGEKIRCDVWSHWHGNGFEHNSETAYIQFYPINPLQHKIMVVNYSGYSVISNDIVFDIAELGSNRWEIVNDEIIIKSQFNYDYKYNADDIQSDNLSIWHDGYNTGYKVGKNDTFLKVRDYINEMKE